MKDKILVHVPLAEHEALIKRDQLARLLIARLEDTEFIDATARLLMKAFREGGE